MSSKPQTQDAMYAYVISDFFQFLSTSLRLPNHELAKAILDGSYGQDAISILGELACSLGDITKVQETFKGFTSHEEEETPFLIQMRREYTRLFDDPKKPAVNIYETLFLHNPEGGSQEVTLFISQAALDVERCYNKAGVCLLKQSAEPADHMATELEFMMYLYAKKGKALQGHDIEEIEKFEGMIKEFADLHLNKWCWDFFNKLESETDFEPYQALCHIGKAGLRKVLI